MIEVLRSGALTTVQDLGRPGHRHEGVAVGGALDELALRVGNLLVGNPEEAAGLEVTLVGPRLRFVTPALIAITGGDLRAEADGRPLPRWRPVRVAAGTEISFGAALQGCRAYLAVAGGIEVPLVLGGRGTDLRAGLGGLEGSALRAGVRLVAGDVSRLAGRIFGELDAGSGSTVVAASWGAGPSLRAGYRPEPAIRMLRGSHTAALTPEARARLFGEPFRVAPQSDRMGYRLEGPVLDLTAPVELLSEGVTPGTVQLPPGGSPIVLMADCQTTGGYPSIGQVASVDLPVIAQLRPGDRLRFRHVSLAEAQGLYLERERDLQRLRLAISLRFQ